MRGAMSETPTVILLAGGEAVRLPRKLERLADGVPLIVRAYRRLAAEYPVVISHSATFAPEIDEQLDAPKIADRWIRRGPLGGILSVCAAIEARRVFVVAGDTPNVAPETLRALCEAWIDGDEAVVPVHDGVIEPLVALFDRAALLREGMPLLEGGGAVRDAIARMRTRYLSMDAELFVNVNTPADWDRAFASQGLASL
jgi:molybdopterin-guanine dinucleotide biosynthesis protein A